MNDRVAASVDAVLGEAAADGLRPCPHPCRLALVSSPLRITKGGDIRCSDAISSIKEKGTKGSGRSLSW